MNSEVKEILERRGESYGDFNAVSGDFWRMVEIIQKGDAWNDLDYNAKTALIMVTMKLSRIINGGLHKDSLLDIQGYIELILKNSVDIKEVK